MTVPAFTLPYNLNRLGAAGDTVAFAASVPERAALADFAGILDVPEFSALIILKKASPTRFAVQFTLTAQVVQACVVTLEPLTAHLTRDFTRELQFTPPVRRPAGETGPKELVIGAQDDDAPEEIESLHYDLAGPLLEEFLLALDPYPRAPGVEFALPEEASGRPESPFMVLKDLKTGDKTGQ